MRREEPIFPRFLPGTLRSLGYGGYTGDVFQGVNDLMYCLTCLPLLEKLVLMHVNFDSTQQVNELLRILGTMSFLLELKIWAVHYWGDDFCFRPCQAHDSEAPRYIHETTNVSRDLPLWMANVHPCECWEPGYSDEEEEEHDDYAGDSDD